MAREVWTFERRERWIRAYVGDMAVADSKKARLMIESPRELDYYFPLAEVRQDLLIPSDKVVTSGYRGSRRFWHLRVGDELVENAVWTYDAKTRRPDFEGYVAFKWRAMDRWFEEEEELFYHPRNPYHRVDTVASSRHIEVYVDDQKVADTHKPFLLHETGLPTRYYLPVEDVDPDFLAPSDTNSYCPYKGKASYYDLVVNGDRIDDAVWYYPEPLPEAPKLKDTVAFWSDKDERIRIIADGEEVA